MIEEFRYSRYSTALDRVKALETISKIFKPGDLIDIELTDAADPPTKVKPYIYLGTKFLRFYGPPHDRRDYYDVIVYNGSSISFITLSLFSLTIRKVKL